VQPHAVSALLEGSRQHASHHLCARTAGVAQQRSGLVSAIAAKIFRALVDFMRHHSSSGSGPVIQLTFRHGDVMNKQIIFNLPVKDLDKSKAFFSALGFSFNPQ
jgi:bleomycin resistance family protein